MPKEDEQGEAQALAELIALERGVAAALRSRASAAALRGLSGVGGALAVRLAEVDADGFVLAGLLVARLRFERLMQGSTAASRWFERDPAGFAASFQAYHAATPARAFFPADEAALFAAFVARQGADEAQG